MKYLKFFTRKARRDHAVIGFSSFTEEEFLLLKPTAKDSASIDDKYADWQKGVETAKRNLSKRAISIVNIPLTVAEIDAYCTENNVENVGATRAMSGQDGPHSSE